MERLQLDAVGSQIRASSGKPHHKGVGDQSKDLLIDSTYLKCRSSSMHLDSTKVKNKLSYLNETLCEFQVLLIPLCLHTLCGKVIRALLPAQAKSVSNDSHGLLNFF